MIFIHEDDFDQIELVPAENYSRFLSEIENTPAHTDEPFGFTEITVRDGHPGVRALNISANELKSYLMSICLSSFTNVTTGYGSSGNTVKNAMAFGFERLGLVVQSDNTIVTNINLVSSHLFAAKDNCDQLLIALHSLGRKFNLVLIDWNTLLAVRLTDLPAIKDYLSEEYDFEIN
jgi:hypothetical protein